MMQYATLEDTVYFWFGANNTSGTGADGSTPVYDVRLGGAASSAAPVLSGSATLLTHANYPDGCHEIAVAATALNGFAAGNSYAVFCTLLVDSQNPTGFVGGFKLSPIVANVTQWNGTNVKSPNTAGVPEVRLTHGLVHGGANTQLNLFSTTADPALYIYNSGTATTGAAMKVESTAGIGLWAYGGLVDILGNGAGSDLGTLTTNITGNLSGSVGSVTGAIGSLGATAQGNVRTAVGLASANLDTQLGDIPTNSELATALITGLTTALTEGYRGTGATGSVRDLLYEIIAHMGESSISGTTKTLKKLDGSTTAKTYTLDSSTTPTAITETT